MLVFFGIVFAFALRRVLREIFVTERFQIRAVSLVDADEGNRPFEIFPIGKGFVVHRLEDARLVILRNDLAMHGFRCPLDREVRREERVVQPRKLLRRQLAIALIDVEPDTKTRIALDVAVDVIAVFVFDVLAKDVGLDDRVAYVMVGLEGLHKRRPVIVGHVPPDFLDTGKGLVMLLGHQGFGRGRDAYLGFDLDIGLADMRFVLHQEDFFVMEGREILREFVTLFDEEHQLADEGRDEAVLIGEDLVFVGDVQDLGRDDVAVIVDFLDILGMGSEVLNRFAGSLARELDRRQIRDLLGRKPRRLDDIAEVEEHFFDLLNPGEVEVRRLEAVHAKIRIFAMRKRVEDEFLITVIGEVLHPFDELRIQLLFVDLRHGWLVVLDESF